MRTVIDIPDVQIEALRPISERAHASRAEVIRRLIVAYVAHHVPDVAEEAFGLWRDREQDPPAIEDENEIRTDRPR